MQGKGRKGTENIKVPHNAWGGTVLLRRMGEGVMFGNPWHGAVQREAYDLIDEALGREVGTFASFKYKAGKILEKADMPMYKPEKWNKARTKIIKPAVPGFNLNEVLGTSAQQTNKAYPYTQFVDLAEGSFNQGELLHFQNKLSESQADMIKALKKGDITKARKIIRKFRDYRSDIDIKKANLGDLYISKEWADAMKIDKNLSGSYKGKAYVKPLSKIYNQMDVDIWKEQYGLDLPEYARKYGINLDVGSGKPIEQILTPGYRDTLITKLAAIKKEFDNNTGDICSRVWNSWFCTRRSCY